MNFSGFNTFLIAIVALSAPLNAVTLDIAIRYTVQGD